MADLKIPNLNKNSDKYIFKKRLTLRRKSKRKLINELLIMFFLSIIMINIIYLIPNKLSVFNNFINNLAKLVEIIIEATQFIYELGLALFIVVSVIIVLILMIGTFLRVNKLLRRKSRKITFK